MKKSQGKKFVFGQKITQPKVKHWFTSIKKTSVRCVDLSWQGEGVPTLAGGYLPWPGTTYLGWRVPTLAGGYLPWRGVPTLAGEYPPWLRVPTLAGRGTYLGCGVPILAGMEYPPGVDKQNKLKLLPFLILRMRAVIKKLWIWSLCELYQIWTYAWPGSSLCFEPLWTRVCNISSSGSRMWSKWT